MEYSCCTSFENLDLVEQAGYDAIALPGWFVAGCDGDTFAKVCARLQASPLQCHSLNAFCPERIRLVGDGHDAQALREYTCVLAERAEKLGVRCVGIGSPNSRKLPEGYDAGRAMEQWETSLRVIAGVLAPYGIQALAEPLCTRECNWMNTTQQVLPVVRRLQLENLGMVFDIYHAFAMGEDDTALREAMPYVRLVHIAQSIDGQKHYLREGHDEDYRPYFRALRDGGYDGEFAVEATYDPLDEALPRSLAIMKGYLANG